MSGFGCHSMYGTLEKLLIKHPTEAFVCPRTLDEQWRKLAYTSCPSFEAAVNEYEDLLCIFQRQGIEIHSLPHSETTMLDSIYAHDAVVITRKGIVRCNMGKEARRGEPVASSSYLETLGIPLLGEITGEGRLEAGDIVWLSDREVAIGEGFRTNREGIRQFCNLLEGELDKVHIVSLPYWNGPDECLHLMSVVSIVDRDLAVVYRKLLPVPLYELLISKGFELIDVLDDEYDRLGSNVLALAPRICVMLEGNPVTEKKLADAGAKVICYRGNEISLKGTGGPTCLTRPILRRVEV